MAFGRIVNFLILKVTRIFDSMFFKQCCRAKNHNGVYFNLELKNKKNYNE